MAGLLAVVLVGACGTSGPPAPKVTMGQQLKGPTPASLLHAPLTTSSGKPFDLASFSGKVVVLSDFLTLCQESCPLDTANMVAAARATEKAGYGDKVEFVSLTIDPKRDTTEQIAAYRDLYAPVPANWIVARGSAPVIAKFWKSLGVQMQKVPEGQPPATNWRTGKKLTYDLNHDDEVFFFDAHGHGKYMLVSIPRVTKGAPIPAKIRHFMDKLGNQNLAHPGHGAWTVPQELQVISWLVGHRITTVKNNG